MNNGAKNITAKLAAIVKEVGWIEKRGHNDFHDYDYVTESDVVEALRGHLANAGIVCAPLVEVVRTERLDKGIIATIEASYIFSDGEETVTVRVGGMGYDIPGDKAIYKAMTGAEKYALKQLFLIPTGDDPERDERGSGRSGHKRDDVQREPASQRNDPARENAGSQGYDTPRPAGGRRDDRDRVIPFNGKVFKKGQNIGEISDPALQEWTEFCESAVARNDKRWHKNNVAKFNACQEEWDKRLPWRRTWKEIQEIGEKFGLDKEGCEVVVKDKLNLSGAEQLRPDDVQLFYDWMKELKKG